MDTSLGYESELVPVPGPPIKTYEEEVETQDAFALFSRYAGGQVPSAELTAAYTGWLHGSECVRTAHYLLSAYSFEGVDEEHGFLEIVGDGGEEAAAPAAAPAAADAAPEEEGGGGRGGGGGGAHGGVAGGLWRAPDGGARRLGRRGRGVGGGRPGARRRRLRVDGDARVGRLRRRRAQHGGGGAVLLGVLPRPPGRRRAARRDAAGAPRVAPRERPRPPRGRCSPTEIPSARCCSSTPTTSPTPSSGRRTTRTRRPASSARRRSRRSCSSRCAPPTTRASRPTTSAPATKERGATARFYKCYWTTAAVAVEDHQQREEGDRRAEHRVAGRAKDAGAGAGVQRQNLPAHRSRPGSPSARTARRRRRSSTSP